MAVFLLLTLLTIAFFVKKGDDGATVLRKVAIGILLFLFLVISYFLVMALAQQLVDSW